MLIIKAPRAVILPLCLLYGGAYGKRQRSHAQRSPGQFKDTPGNRISIFTGGHKRCPSLTCVKALQQSLTMNGGAHGSGMVERAKRAYPLL